MGVERKILKALGVSGSIALTGWFIGFGVDQGAKPMDAYGQPLGGWPTRPAATITPIATPTLLSTPDIQATVHAVMTASAPTPDIRATVSAVLTVVAVPNSNVTPDILATIQSFLKSLPTPLIIKPEIVKPEVVKPEVVKPEVVKPEVIQPQPASRSAEPDLVGTAISEATLNALVAKDRAALQATATAKMEGTVTAEAKQSATADARTAIAEARLTPTIAVRIGQNGEEWPWWVIGAVGVGLGALLVAAGSNKERITRYIHEYYHHPVP